jgi:hypothetical protein
MCKRRQRRAEVPERDPERQEPLEDPSDPYIQDPDDPDVFPDEGEEPAPEVPEPEKEPVAFS